MDNNVLVTGAASGIGAATCARLSDAGWSVFALDRDEAGLERLGQAVPLVGSLVVDLTSAEAISAALSGLSLQAVANVAGVGPDTRHVGRIFAINLLAPLWVLDAVRPTLADGGAVVNVASITGELAGGEFDELLDDALDDAFLNRAEDEVADEAAAYMYSKRGLIRHTRRLAVEWAPAVRVNAVSPGLVDTPMGERSMQYEWTRKVASRIPAGRLAGSDEVAAVISFLLGPEASYITGSSLCVDGGYVAKRLLSHERTG